MDTCARVVACRCAKRLPQPGRCTLTHSHTHRADATHTHTRTAKSNSRSIKSNVSATLVGCSGTCMCLSGDWVTLKGLKELWGEVNDFPTLHLPQKPNKVCQRWEYKISEWEFFLASDIQRNSISGPSVVPRTSRRAGLCWSVHINLLPLADGECHSVRRCIFKEYRPDNGAIKHIILQSNRLCLRCTWSRSHFQAT